ncbi:hypothetical protein HID58_054373, partial [Brassica napus]
MLHLSGVLGDWKMNKESWRFKVNTRARGKLFTIKEGLKFDEMVEMVHEDFGINRLGNECCSKKKSWAIGLMCKFTPLHLCISVKNGNLGNHDQGFSRKDTAVDGKGHGNKNKNVDRQESNQEPEVEVSNFHDAKNCCQQVRQEVVSCQMCRYKLQLNTGGPRASSKVISKLLLQNFRNSDLNMKPELISSTMKKRYGLDTKYWKIWKAREDARTE